MDGSVEGVIALKRIVCALLLLSLVGLAACRDVVTEANDIPLDSKYDNQVTDWQQTDSSEKELSLFVSEKEVNVQAPIGFSDPDTISAGGSIYLVDYERKLSLFACANYNVEDFSPTDELFGYKCSLTEGFSSGSEVYTVLVKLADSGFVEFTLYDASGQLTRKEAFSIVEDSIKSIK